MKKRDFINRRVWYGVSTLSTFIILLFSTSVGYAGWETVPTTLALTGNQYPVSIVKTGEGSGTVSSSPRGISCGVDCSETFNENIKVTLTAKPAFDSTFTGWGGACSGTKTTCVVTMDGAKEVTADFVPIPRATLTVTKTGDGSGTVTGLPKGIVNGINCGTDCSDTYLLKNPSMPVKVTLTAKPIVGSSFWGWSGACTGTGTCSVFMSESRSVTANFENVEVSISPTSATVQADTRLQFNATVKGSANQAVKWRVNDVVGGNSIVGKISKSGLYTSPISISAPGQVTVSATSVAFPSKSAVTILDLSPLPNHLSGAFNFAGPYPAPDVVTYKNRDAQTLTTLAFPGQIFMIVSPSDMNAGKALQLIRANSGKIIAQIPSSGVYWVQVTVGNEAKFITAVLKNPSVIYAAPNFPLTSSQSSPDVVDLSGATSTTPVILGGQLIAQFDLFSHGPKNDVCGYSHGTAVEKILQENGQDSSAFEVTQFKQGTNEVALYNGQFALAAGSDVGFGLNRAAEGALLEGHKMIANMSLQAPLQPNDGIYRGDCEVNPGLVQCSCRLSDNGGVCDGTYAGWKSDEFAFLVGIASELEHMRGDLLDNTMVVISAGNSGLDLTREISLIQGFFPNAFTHMLIVGSLDSGGQPYTGHNFSTDPSQMIYAPGVNVAVPELDGCAADGTSFASPAVANLAAQLAQQFPALRTDQLVAAIQDAAPAVNGLPVIPTLDDAVLAAQALDGSERFVYQLTASATGSGTVTTRPGMITCGGAFTTCGASYPRGTVVTLTAVPTNGSTFEGWGGACSGFGLNPVCTLTMNADEAVGATFGTCTYSISPTSQSFGSSGGDGSVDVIAPSGCGWAATSNSPAWIMISSGSDGSGDGSITYEVLNNGNTSQRTGTISIAGKTFTVTQSGKGTGISGTWAGNYTLSSDISYYCSNIPTLNNNGTVTMNLSQDADGFLTGTVSMSGLRTWDDSQGWNNCTLVPLPSSSGPIRSGFISGSMFMIDVELGHYQGINILDFNGTRSGSTISGTISYDGTGTFSVTKQ
jgi:hypothetical protein